MRIRVLPYSVPREINVSSSRWPFIPYELRRMGGPPSLPDSIRHSGSHEPVTGRPRGHGGRAMKWRIFVLSLVLALPRLTPAATQNRFIVRTTLSLQSLTQLCLLPTLGCTVVGGLDGSLNQLFLLTTPSIVDPTIFLTTLRATAGIVAAELDQLLSMVGGLNKVTTAPTGLSDTTLVTYYGSPGWHGYRNKTPTGKGPGGTATKSF